MRVLDYAKYFLSKDPMSLKQLNALLYYAYKTKLEATRGKEKLFSETIQAGCDGIEIRELYKYYSQYNELGMFEINDKTTILDNYSLSDRALLDMVYGDLGSLSERELMLRLLKEPPYLVAREVAKTLNLLSFPIRDSDILEWKSLRENRLIKTLI